MPGVRRKGPHDPRGAPLSAANRFPGGMALAQIVPVEMPIPGGVRVVEYTDPELTLYESGKTLIKTADAEAARRAIDRVYAVLGIAAS